MTPDPRAAASLFTQVDISAGPHSAPTIAGRANDDLLAQLLRDILAAQDRQNELMEELISQVGTPQRQRNSELTQWKQANPALMRSCRQAAETLSKVQTEFLTSLTDEVQVNADSLLDGEFMLTEFVDRFGPRLAHLNGVLQILSQLGSPVQQQNATT